MQQLFDFIDCPEIDDGATVLDYRVIRNMARAAEFFVAYDVSRRGWDCFTVGEGLRYDLIADIKGVRRIQVKSNRCVRDHRGSNIYSFGDKATGKLRDYIGDVDLFAFVAMDRQIILYAIPDKIRNSLWVPSTMMTPERSDLSWAEVMRSWGVD